MVRRGSTMSSTATSGSDGFAPARVVLLGVECLVKEIPKEWERAGVFVALVSEADEFEDVGRELLASGEAEIRERLRTLGIGEYLLLPVSLEGLRKVVLAAVRR